MRALTPDPLRREDQVSPLTPLCFPNIPPPTTPCARTSLYQSPQRVRQIPGFAMYEQARRHMPPNRVRQPTGCSFVSGCSPPRPRGDAVTFDYMGCDFPRQGLSPC